MTTNEKRPYDRTLRTARAAETRARIIEAATELFARDGYAATTMADIAQAAGVSVDTVYANGPKAELIYAAIEIAGFGREGIIPFFEHDIGRDAAASPDPEVFAQVAAEHAVKIFERMADVWLAFDAAADTDPTLAERRDRSYEGIVLALHEVIDLCAANGWLGGELSRDQRVGILLALVSAEFHRRMSRLAGLGRSAHVDTLRRIFRWVLFGRA